MKLRCSIVLARARPDSVHRMLRSVKRQVGKPDGKIGVGVNNTIHTSTFLGGSRVAFD